MVFWRCLPHHSLFSTKNNGKFDVFYLILMKKAGLKNKARDIATNLRNLTNRQIGAAFLVAALIFAIFVGTFLWAFSAGQTAAWDLISATEKNLRFALKFDPNKTARVVTRQSHELHRWVDLGK